MARISRRTILTTTLAAGMALGTGVQAQSWPTQPIEAVVAFAAGGFADTIGRIVAQGVSERLGQPIVVSNQGGAGGNIAATRISRADADGYTMLITTSSIALSQSIYSSLEYDLMNDLQIIAAFASSPEILAANPSVPANNVAELIDWARAQGEVTFASAGVGSTSHLVADYFLNTLAGVNAVHVTYSGGGPANQAAISGEVDLVGSSNAAYPFVREGLLKGIAIASLSEHDAVPGVATFDSQGFEGFTGAAWVSFFMPAGVDPAIVERMNAEVNAVLADPATRERLAQAGVQLHQRDVAESRAFLEAEIDNWRTMVAAVGIEVQ